MEGEQIFPFLGSYFLPTQLMPLSSCFLNYVSIEIPTTIPRSMFERELDYYGITSADYLITVEDSVVTTLKSFIKEEFVKTKREHEMCLLALECYNQFYQSCNASGIVFIRQGHKLFNRTKSSLDFEEKKLLDYYLGRHGLMVDGRHENNTVCRGGGCFFVCTKR
jgi:hypothetical protein